MKAALVTFAVDSLAAGCASTKITPQVGVASRGASYDSVMGFAALDDLDKHIFSEAEMICSLVQRLPVLALDPPSPKATGGCRLPLHQLSGSRSRPQMRCRRLASGFGVGQVLRWAVAGPLRNVGEGDR